MAGSIPEALGIDWQEWGRYGLRWADERYRAGDALPPSHDWCPYCSEPLGSRPPDERWCPDCSWAEETVLAGTCAVEVTQETLGARLADSHYAGEHIYLIAADYGSYGDDPHEVVLGSADHPAVVVARLDGCRLPRQAPSTSEPAGTPLGSPRVMTGTYPLGAWTPARALFTGMSPWCQHRAVNRQRR